MAQTIYQVMHEETEYPLVQVKAIHSTQGRSQSVTKRRCQILITIKAQIKQALNKRIMPGSVCRVHLVKCEASGVNLFHTSPGI